MLDMTEMKEAKYSTLSYNEIFEIGAIEKMKNLMLLQLKGDVSLLKLVVLDMSYNKRSVFGMDTSTLVYLANCPKLCEVEGHYKIQSIDKVERKIIKYLGLESNEGDEMKLGLEVFHEFGIFNTFVSEKQIPLPSYFMYREIGHSISFEVPSHPTGLRIIGFNLCAVFSQSNISFPCLEIRVHNYTRCFRWSYWKDNQDAPKNAKKLAWLSVWRGGNLLEAGDKFGINVIFRLMEVEKCCINLIYEDDEQLDGETNEAYNKFFVF